MRPNFTFCRACFFLGSLRFSLLPALLLALTLSACHAPSTELPASRPTLVERLQAPVAASVAQHGGARLLAMRVDGRKFIIDVSRELLTLGTGRALEDAIRSIHGAAAPAALEIDNIEYVLLIDGVPLGQFLK